MAGAGDQTARAHDHLPDVPGYRIDRQIGRGSMGTVYLARDERLRRRVALKVLTPALADDELFRKRFDRESQSAANLDHPNIVPVYAAGEAGDQLFIAMRYVSGGDLRALLADVGPLGLEETAQLISAVGAALDAAHAAGMIHRDIKPANVLVDDRTDRPHYYLSDFGIAKMLSEATGRSLTSAGQIVGTIDYVAPEQIQGKPVDGRADLYALGCVLFQVLTDQVPFPREDTAALMFAHVQAAPPAVTALRPELPGAIDRILATALAKNPAHRYPTGAALAADLRALAADPSFVPVLGTAATKAAADTPVETCTASPAAETGTETPVGTETLTDETPTDETPTEGTPADDPAPDLPDGTSTYTPPAALRATEPEPATPPAPASRRKLVVAVAGAAAFVLLTGSAVAGVDYLSSRYPNDAEETLLRDVPLALQDSCGRNEAIVEGSANVEASLVCKPSGGDVNSFVFTRFATPSALEGNYQAAVATAGISGGSGDCRSGDRAETGYRSETEASHGRVMCFQKRGSSFLTWTDEQSRTLGVATRHDPKNDRLREWWAGVNGVKLSESEPAPAAAVPPPVSAPVVAAPSRPSFDPGVFGPEMDMSSFRADSDEKDSDDGGSDSGGSDGGGSSGGSSSGGLGGGSSDGGSDDESSEEKDKDDKDKDGQADALPPSQAANPPGTLTPEQLAQIKAEQERLDKQKAQQEQLEREKAKQEEERRKKAEQDKAEEDRKKREQEAKNNLEDSWIEAIKNNESLRREAEKRCDGAEKDGEGRIKDSELREQCGKFDEKYRK